MKLPDEPWPGEYPARPQPPTETFPEFYRSCATRNKCSQPLRCWLNSTTRGQTRRAAEAARAFSFQSRGVTAITGTPRQYGPRLSIAERSSPGLRIADETVTRFQWPDPSPPISVLEKKENKIGTRVIRDHSRVDNIAPFILLQKGGRGALAASHASPL